MTRRERRRSRLDREAVEENDRIGFGASSGKPSKPPVSSDDEANEDLSLKIVEKALLIRAAKLVPEDVVVIEIDDSTASEEKEVSGSRTKKASKKVDKKRKKVKKKEIEGEDVFVMKEEEDKSEVVEAESGVLKPNLVEDSDNIVLRKLLRGPRYFDPPGSSWGTCYNCGEEGHAAVNCTVARRRKPCFVCGSLEHNVKQCIKGRDCFICKKSGHRAKDCPEKYKSSSAKSKICLKCGDSGHDMFSCRSDYNHDDLKEICCYVCNKPGHLCCAQYVNSCPKEVSCYRCGQLGHTGLSCSRSNGETAVTESASLCFKCGKGGHFARECTSSLKNGKRVRDPSTPSLKPHKERKHDKGHKSAPHDLGKDHKKKKTRHEESRDTTPRKAKHRGGWITEDPGDYSLDRNRNNGWRSPATPIGQRLSYMGHGGHASTPQPSGHARHAYGTPHFYGQSNGFHQFQNGHSGSRFGHKSGGSSGGGGSGWNNRNYGW